MPLPFGTKFPEIRTGKCHHYRNTERNCKHRSQADSDERVLLGVGHFSAFVVLYCCPAAKPQALSLAVSQGQISMLALLLILLDLGDRCERP